MKEHKHAAVIRAYAAGHKIEWRNSDHTENSWKLTPNPSFFESCEYRVYEEPKPDVVKFNNVYPIGSLGAAHDTAESAKKAIGADNAVGMIKLTYDGNTGKLKAAEVVQ